ncbi:unnamed protein product [marine sediment metagenome]|uniref:Uncharacterized protein n=1 Tax=marine sediment metagenome TaxID=412755 RepID=X1TZ45_9ZZZZ
MNPRIEFKTEDGELIPIKDWAKYRILGWSYIPKENRVIIELDELR